VDMHRLFAEITNECGEALQLIVVDNDLPPAIVVELRDSIALPCTKTTASSK